MQVSFTAVSNRAKLTLSRDSGKGNTKFDDIRIVQKSLKNNVSPTEFKQDFESVVQGIYPFVIGNTEGVKTTEFICLNCMLHIHKKDGQVKN